MNVLPIVTRELRTRAKNRGTYWVRFVVVLFAVLMCVPQLIWAGPGSDPTSTSQQVFSALVLIAFVLSCSAFLLTADVISRERREGTIGLLFLARVKSYDIIAGKLCSASLTSLAGLLGLLPMLMIPVLGGGLTGGEAFRKGLVLLNTVFLSLAIGIRASSRGVDSFRTARVALMTVLMLVLGPGFLELIVRLPNVHTSGIGLLSPLVNLLDASETAYAAGQGRFWTSFALIHAMGWIALRQAATSLKSSMHDGTGVVMNEPQNIYHPVWNKLPRVWEFKSPIEWLVRRQSGIHATVWMAAVVLLVYYTASPLLYGWARYSGAYWAVLWPIGILVSLVVDALVARVASRFFLESRASGQLELLLVTPLGIREILRGQWRALAHLLLRPIGLAMLVGLLSLTVTLAQIVPYFGTGGVWSLVHYPINWLFNVANTLFTIATVCWLGMWFALRGHSPLGIMARAATLATIGPAIFKAIASLVYRAVVPQVLAGGMLAWMAGWWAQQLIVFVYYVWLIRLARQAVRLELSGAESFHLSSLNRLSWRTGLRLASRPATP